MKFVNSILILLFITVACEPAVTDTNEPFEKVAIEPKLTFQQVNSDSIAEYGDLVFTISYIDGDGDIGSYNPDEPTLYVVDSRENITSSYHLQPLNPQPGNESVIEGVLEINLDNVIMLHDTTEVENAFFTIYLYDQAGTKSNEVVSPTITIYR